MQAIISETFSHTQMRKDRLSEKPKHLHNLKDNKIFAPSWLRSEKHVQWQGRLALQRNSIFFSCKRNNVQLYRTVLPVEVLLCKIRDDVG